MLGSPKQIFLHLWTIHFSTIPVAERLLLIKMDGFLMVQQWNRSVDINETTTCFGIYYQKELSRRPDPVRRYRRHHSFLASPKLNYLGTTIQDNHLLFINKVRTTSRLEKEEEIKLSYRIMCYGSFLHITSKIRWPLLEPFHISFMTPLFLHAHGSHSSLLLTIFSKQSNCR